MFDFTERTKALLGLTATIGLSHSISWLMRQQQLKKFEKVGTVKELVVYPVKSCKGVYISQAKCTPLGLSVDGVTDRHWMLIRENNRFLSQRQEPKMALITVTTTGDGISLDAPNMTPLKLPAVPRKNGLVRNCRTTIDTPVEGIDCGDDAAAWVNSYLGTSGIRVVQYGESLAQRDFSHEVPVKWETTSKDGDHSVYSDWASYLLATESSLGALNEELPSPVTLRYFRPNIILEGTTAYDEDNWTEVRIGNSVQMRCVSACPRCVLTTVDPDKAERRADGEPLKTLQRVRKSAQHADKAMFGMFMAPDVCGTVKVGDPVYALRKSAT